ncbi:MAG: guanylate kinase [Planctomycetota bacterium]
MARSTDIPGRLVVVTGPSGAGKSTILRRVLSRTEAHFSVSATTREPREGELSGRDYFFVSRSTFEDMIEAGEMLEWAEVHGALYGTPAAPVVEKVSEGATVVLDVDVQGGLQVHQKHPEGTFVLIVPPKMDELRRRLEGRGTESQEKVERRLAKADEELKTARRSGVYNYEVVNDDLDRAIDELEDIVRGNK